MADDDAKPTESTAEEKAAEAAKAVAENQEATERAAADAVARANAEAEEAKKASAAIAAGAMQNEIGTRFESYKGEVDKWRTETAQRQDQLQAQLAATENQLGEVKAGLGLILGALKPANPSPSTPEKSDEAPTPEAKAKNPDQNAGDRKEAPPPAAPSRKKAWL